jgi:hypothetical protein
MAKVRLGNPGSIETAIANTVTAQGNINGWAYSIPPSGSLDVANNTDYDKALIESLKLQWPMLTSEDVVEETPPPEEAPAPEAKAAKPKHEPEDEPKHEPKHETTKSSSSKHNY